MKNLFVNYLVIPPVSKTNTSEPPSTLTRAPSAEGVNEFAKKSNCGGSLINFHPSIKGKQTTLRMFRVSF
jgi:hypothetical protein